MRYNRRVCTVSARISRRARMKSVIAAVLVFCAAVAGAESVDIGSVRQNLFATCFASDQEGWMVGELGRIFRTTDGGRDLGAAGRRHEAALPRHRAASTPRPPGSPARRASSTARPTAARPGRSCQTGLARATSSRSQFATAAARPRRRRLRHHGPHRGRRAAPGRRRASPTTSSCPRARSTPASTPAT